MRAEDYAEYVRRYDEALRDGPMTEERHLEIVSSLFDNVGPDFVREALEEAHLRVA